ncbi:fasciclin domain-containing protein [Flavobacterium enshiense DK69]|uniref:Fasciclin n=1 Tax=Flavobacterium enshiense DK69 TaxID=1107311 RepID=V6SAW2_9FLAO|nr:fasciclin domain-containing protein [Flavobacterium enshiense]ESU23382.1 fasciclin domain-containing protein [Flavobacterium enshiense DK69]KGO96390.1 fasciclin [Flavobacterium enshiense DK69]
MKTIKFFVLAGLLMAIGCKKAEETKPDATTESTATESVGQSGVKDETSAPNIVQTAAGSKDFTTLVTAVKAAGLVDALSNAGPFTVFAPTNAAFDKLPKGTVEDLLKPENKDKLKSILEYHTYVGSLKTDYMSDGQSFEMVSGGKVNITKQGDKTLVNGSEITASIETSNGIIHVIGDVLSQK